MGTVWVLYGNCTGTVRELYGGGIFKFLVAKRTIRQKAAI